ncbi:MAG: twin transmembrane helix small protein [Burkholderiaceae bacterium]|nr:MAG: twin transmembrane helix small protein [Burkholderiaceae bacterium]MBE7426528.1 twin transmembrane helix small protein [Ideonella sp.]MCC7286474.1 twin transmembrane helix small protein [Burkholderiaceae bacterium]
MSLLTLAIVLAFAATLYSLICGVASMVSGGEIRQHNSVEWMMRRVGFQALAVILLLVAVFQS